MFSYVTCLFSDRMHKKSFGFYFLPATFYFSCFISCIDIDIKSIWNILITFWIHTQSILYLVSILYVFFLNGAKWSMSKWILKMSSQNDTLNTFKMYAILVSKMKLERWYIDRNASLDATEFKEHITSITLNSNLCNGMYDRRIVFVVRLSLLKHHLKCRQTQYTSNSK